MSGRRSARLRNQAPTPALSNDELARLERSGNRARREAAAAARATVTAPVAAPVPAVAAAQTAVNEATPTTRQTQGDSSTNGNADDVNVTAQGGPAAGTEPPVPENTEATGAIPTGSSAPNPPAEVQPSGSNIASTPTQSVTGQGPEKASDPCDDLEILLQELKTQALAAVAAQPTNPPAVGQPLDDNTVARAIAAVTEAISSNNITGAGSTQFTLVDPETLQARRDSRGVQLLVDPTQQVGRPGNEALLVRLDGSAGRAHYSLLFLRRSGDNQFEFQSYDSAQNDYHRLDLQSVGNEFRDHLHDLGWDRANSGAGIANGATVSDPPARQRNGWECGVYVIVYAWALALGLDISGFANLRRERSTRFRARAIDLILLALQGHCSSALIEAFLKCFGVVPQDATVPDGRQFDRTTPFLNENALRTHIARLRLQHDLPGGLPTLDEVLHTIQEGDPDFGRDLWTLTANGVAEQFSLTIPLPPDSPTNSTPSGSKSGNLSKGASGNTRKSGGKGATGDTQTKGGQAASSGTQPPVGSGLQNPESNGPSAPSSGNPGQQTGNSAPDSDPCARLAENLHTLEALSNERTQNLIFAVQAGQMLADETVYRAIASVTEALSESTNGPRFSLVSLLSIGLPQSSPQRQRIARPGNPALIPHTTAPPYQHTSLFSLEQPAPGQQFVLRHYDSARTGHTSANRLRRAAADTRIHLLTLQWEHNNTERIRFLPIPRSNLTRQSHGWECGMHAIFYAWAIALGLSIDGNGSPAPPDRFFEDGRRIINYALHGQVDSATILAFLQCYGFVARAQTVPEERTFHHTFPFTQQTALEERIAWLRVREDLDQLRQTDPAVPTIEDLDNRIPGAAQAYLTHNGTEMLEQYRMLGQNSPHTPTLQNLSTASDELSPNMQRSLALIAEAEREEAERQRALAEREEQEKQRALALVAELEREEEERQNGSGMPDAGRAPSGPPRLSPGASSKDTGATKELSSAPAAEGSPSHGNDPPADNGSSSRGNDGPAGKDPSSEGNGPPPDDGSCSSSDGAPGPTASRGSLAATTTVADGSSSPWSPGLDQDTPNGTNSTPPTELSSAASLLTQFQGAINATGPAPTTTTTTVNTTGPADPLDAEAQSASASSIRTETPFSDPSPSMIRTQPLPRGTPGQTQRTQREASSVESDSSLRYNEDDTLFGERDLQQDQRQTSPPPAGEDSTLQYNEDDTLFGEGGNGDQDDDDDEEQIITEAPASTRQAVRPLTIEVPPHQQPGLALPPPTPGNTAPPLNQATRPEAPIEEQEDTSLQYNEDDTLFGERDLQENQRQASPHANGPASEPANEDSTLQWNEDDTLFGERDLPQNTPTASPAAPRSARPPLRPLSIVPPSRFQGLALPPPTPRNTAPPLDGGPRGVLPPMNSAGLPLNSAGLPVTSAVLPVSAGWPQPSPPVVGTSGADGDGSAGGGDAAGSRKRALDDDGSAEQPAKRTRRDDSGDAE